MVPRRIPDLDRREVPRSADLDLRLPSLTSAARVVLARVHLTVTVAIFIETIDEPVTVGIRIQPIGLTRKFFTLTRRLIDTIAVAVFKPIDDPVIIAVRITWVGFALILLAVCIRSSAPS